MTEDDFIPVRCPGCRSRFQERFRELRDVAIFQHKCGAFVQCNLNELDAFVRDGLRDPAAYLDLHRVP
jgi:hypothetical protein